MLNFFSDVMTVAFQTDQQGRTLFFPWGIISRGYVIPDAATERRIKTFYRFYYVAGLVVLIPGFILLGWPGVLSISALVFLWYFIQVKIYLRRCESGNVTIREHMRDIARKYNLVALWSLFVFSVVVGLSGGILMIMEELLAGIVFALLFGGVAVMYGSLLWLRKAGDQ